MSLKNRRKTRQRTGTRMHGRFSTLLEYGPEFCRCGPPQRGYGGAGWAVK
jgi:hypothetical protein